MKTFLLATGFIIFHLQVFSQDVKTHSVYFGLNQHAINDSESQKLNTWLNQFTDTIKKAEVTGYADYLDSDAYNLELSEKRANSVMEVLEANSRIQYRMSLLSANGEKNAKPSSDTAKGNSEDRRVDISFHLQEKPVAVISKPVKQSIEKPINTESDLLERATVGQTIVLKNLNFFPGRHFLIPQALPELERLVDILSRNETMEIEIQGHICCKLDSIDAKDVDTQTYSLSLNRAKYIHDQLVLAGIDSTRMKYRGFAGSRPLYNPEITAKHRNRNRRVEIKVLKK